MNRRAILFLAREDLRLLLSSKETWLWTFLMPVVFFFFMGTMLGGAGRPPGAGDELVVVASAGAGVLEGELVARLAEQGLPVRRVPSATSVPPGVRHLVLPEGLTDDVLAGRARTLRLVGGRGDLAAEHDLLRARAAAWTVLADLVLLRAEGSPASAEAFAELRGRPRSPGLDVRPAGRPRAVPRGFQQAVPGTLAMFTLLVLLTSGASLVTIERRRGLLSRLASAPLSRLEVVAAKLGGKVLMAAVQIGFALAVGALVFDVRWATGASGALGLALLLGVYGLFAAALGLLVGNLARTEGQAVGLGVLAANLLAALGGCWWPIEVTPAWMRLLARLLPTGWVMRGLHELSSFGGGAEAVAGEVALLVLATGLAVLLAARTFRFR